MVNLLILTSNNDEVAPEQNFGACRVKGRKRKKQEDTLTWQHFEDHELSHVTPEQIGQCLSVSYQTLHTRLKKEHPDTRAGTTASTTVIHENHLITATLGDAVSFAVAYDRTGAALGVKRLNTRTHDFDNEAEITRVQALEGVISRHSDDVGRVSNNKGRRLAVSRAIGDFSFAPYLIADADIDITSVIDIAHELCIKPQDIAYMQVITTSDGYTECLKNSKEAHEYFLSQGIMRALRVTETELAEHLTQQALTNHSNDNISIAVQTFDETYSGMVGVYDGHGGTDASHFVAKNISSTLMSQLQISNLINKEYIMSPPIISKPTKDEEKEIKDFGAYEIQNEQYRLSQEDALVQQKFQFGELSHLTPEQIGQRLWTSYRELHDNLKLYHPHTPSGTTASTTVIHKGNLITATLADALSFVVIYGEEGAVLDVKRLNTRTHSPGLPEELQRIKGLKSAEGITGSVIFDPYGGPARVFGAIAVSRAIGDFDFAPFLIADADIDITSINDVAEELQISPEQITRMQVITTCDGYTERLSDTKETHEAFLRKGIGDGNMTELELAKKLTQQAVNNGSSDNISIAVQTFDADYSGMVAVYDGHSGTDASHFVADNISATFTAQCYMTEDAYAEQENSVHKNQDVFERDHVRRAPTPPAPTSTSIHEHKEVDNVCQVSALTRDLNKKLAPLVKQKKRLQERAKSSCETRQSRTEIQDAYEALQWLEKAMVSTDKDLTPDLYLQRIQTSINAVKDATKNARGLFSINRMLQHLSDWITSCFCKQPNPQRFFKTTTEQTLETLSDNVSQLSPK